ncbi:acyltransferase family protein [Cryomorphaceae bacterium]|nr:acyltransferase family protein [Cryomorphaceae bacterium]
MAHPSKSERLHALDALRAIMMLLGIVIHSAITYGTVDYGSAWSLKDPVNHWSNDFIVAFIHAFRMQIFFLVSGFFSALLFYDRSPGRMIQNRVKRIALPFIVFLFVLWPSIKFGFVYTGSVFSGEPESWGLAVTDLWSLGSILPNNTFHLWFLYTLIWITMFSIGFAFFFVRFKKMASKIHQGFRFVLQRPLLRLLVLGLLTMGVYGSINTWSAPVSGSFIPNFLSIVYYLFFYLIGWVLFKSKDLLGQMERGFGWNFALGMVLFCIHFFLYDSWSFWEHVAIKSLMVWGLIFGITGAFIRYGSDHSPTMRYVSDSSYWVYLVHLSWTAFLPGLLADWAVPSTVKFLTVAAITSVFCFVTYHYIVRATFIGAFLNGRRYERKLPR